MLSHPAGSMQLIKRCCHTKCNINQTRQIYEKKSNGFLSWKEKGAQANFKNEANIYYLNGLSDAGFGYCLFAGDKIFI